MSDRRGNRGQHPHERMARERRRASLRRRVALVVYVVAVAVGGVVIALATA